MKDPGNEAGSAGECMLSQQHFPPFCVKTQLNIDEHGWQFKEKLMMIRKRLKTKQ